jgi:hypothetical protein
LVLVVQPWPRQAEPEMPVVQLLYLEVQQYYYRAVAVAVLLQQQVLLAMPVPQEVLVPVLLEQVEVRVAQEAELVETVLLEAEAAVLVDIQQPVGQVALTEDLELVVLAAVVAAVVPVM